MLKRASLVLICTVGLFSNSPAYAQMQQGYATDKPDVMVDRSVLQDLKGYQPPPMFGGDLVPPPSNRLNPKKEEDLPPSVEVTPPAQPSFEPKKTGAVAIPAPSTMTAPNAEDLLKHPTQNFHVLTERSASAPMTAPTPAPAQDIEPLDGPLLPLPGDDNDPAMAHARAVKAKETAEKKQPPSKEVKKSDISKKEDKKKEEKKKTSPEKSTPSQKEKESEKPASAKPQLIKPNPNAYKPKASQTMPAIPPIHVEKNVLPPLSGTSPLPKLPDPSATSETIAQPSIGERMMDAALTRQMESDEGKIKEQLAETEIKTIKKESRDEISTKAKTGSQSADKIKTSSRTLVFGSGDMGLTDRMKAQIKMHILPDLQKDKDARIEILSFASAENGNDSTARRVSLARALAVRDYLKGAKIDVSRMEVRALASKGDEKPSDKIDIVLMK